MPNLEYEDFINSLGIAIALFLKDAKANSEFKSIYNKGMAAFNVLDAWSPDNKELLSAAGVTKRVTALLCIRQYSLVNVELRRFIECITWYIYFADHPIEWEMFKNNPGRSWDKRPEKPIEAAAHSPMNYYLRYMQERMVSEPSGLAIKAMGIFRNEYDKLSVYVHGATPAIHGSLALIYDREDPEEHKKIRHNCHNIFKSGCILVAALKTQLLEDLNTTDRKYFDKLVSPSAAKKIREQPFGL